jgi:hypothetical protein
LKGGTNAYSTLAQDYAVTSASGTHLLRRHRSCAVVPAPATPSRALQCHPRRCGGTGRQDTATPAAVHPTASRQSHPRVNLRTMTQRRISTPPPSKPLLGGHRARHDAPSEAGFARTVVHSIALYAMPLHVAGTVRHTCKLPPPWPIKGGAVPWPQGGQRQIAFTRSFSAFSTISALASIKTSGTWRPSLLSHLACSPLCKHYGVTQ